MDLFRKKFHVINAPKLIITERLMDLGVHARLYEDEFLCINHNLTFTSSPYVSIKLCKRAISLGRSKLRGVGYIISTNICKWNYELCMQSPLNKIDESISCPRSLNAHMFIRLESCMRTMNSVYCGLCTILCSFPKLQKESVFLTASGYVKNNDFEAIVRD